MGYQVKIFPPKGRSGYLEYGRLAAPNGMGTYYPHPSNALAAARRWVAKHPGGRAQVEIYREGCVVEEVS